MDYIQRLVEIGNNEKELEKLVNEIDKEVWQLHRNLITQRVKCTEIRTKDLELRVQLVKLLSLVTEDKNKPLEYKIQLLQNQIVEIGKEFVKEDQIRSEINTKHLHLSEAWNKILNKLEEVKAKKTKKRNKEIKHLSM